MERKINFGKHAINSKRKINDVNIVLRLEETKDGKPVFTACGEAWNICHTDIVIGGQCLDTLAKYIHNPLFKEIFRLWKSHHLNDMNAGTEEQEKAIAEWRAEGNRYDYTKACEYLKSINLYEVEHEGKPYKYGHGWIYRAIPNEDLELIKKIIETGNI